MGEAAETQHAKQQSQAVVPAIAAIYAALLALPLLLSPIFALDWVNHLWLANYVAHHFAASWALPMFVNVPTNIGNPVLAFYGTSVYGALAPFVWFLGPNIGMRLGVFAAFLLPTIGLARVIQRCIEDRWAAACLTIVLSTSLYQLTNIYTRGAVTEFFAYQFLLFGLVTVIDALLDDRGSSSPLKITVGLTSAVLGVLSHPPTAYLAILFLGIPVLAFLVLQRSRLTVLVGQMRLHLVWLLVLLVPIAACATLVATYGPILGLDRLDRLLFFPASIDHWLARLLPWPMDFRVDVAGLDQPPTPYLSAPINTPALGLMLGWFGARLMFGNQQATAGRSALLVYAALILIGAGATLLLSLPVGALGDGASIQGAIPGVFYADASSWRSRALGQIQFAYRLVNVTNFTIVFGCLTLMLMCKQRQWNDAFRWLHRDRDRTLLAIAATVCAMGASMKVVEVYKEFSFLPEHSARLSPNMPRPGGVVDWSSPDNIREMGRAVLHTSLPPSTQYGLSFYTMPALFPAFHPEEQVAVERISLRPVGASTAVAEKSCERPCALITDLVPSPFFALSIDGTLVPESELRVTDGFMTIRANPGDHLITVSLGTWVTTLYASSILALVTLFWSSLALLVGRELMTTRADEAITVVPA